MSNPENRESKKNARQGQSNSSARPLSIEGPSTFNNAEQIPPQSLPNQPRQPTNLQELLKYAMDAAQSEDSENKPSVYPLDGEKKTFLNDALSSLTVNVVEELQKAVQILSNVVNLRADDDSLEFENVLEIATPRAARRPPLCPLWHPHHCASSPAPSAPSLAPSGVRLRGARNPCDVVA